MAAHTQRSKTQSRYRAFLPFGKFQKVGVFLVSLVVAASLLITLGPTKEALASTPDLTVNSSHVEVQSVTAPYGWQRSTTIYEGSPARLILDVTVVKAGSARIAATLSGVDTTVGDSTITLSVGSQIATVPLSLNYGAWLSDGTANTGTTLQVQIDFTPTPATLPGAPSGSSIPPDSTISTQTVSTQTDSPGSDSPESVPNNPTLVSESSSPASLNINFPQNVKSAGPVIRRQLTKVLGSVPPNSQVRVTLQPVLPRGIVTARDRRESQARLRSLVSTVKGIARSNGQQVEVEIGPTVRVNRSKKSPSVQLRIRWSVPEAIVLRARNGASTQSTSVTVNFTLAPRPVVMLHGLWSTAATWNDYSRTGGYLKTQHPAWEGYAVSTMNTGSLLSPFGTVNTVDQNADASWSYLVGIQALTNAHEVDIVAHSMGGIVTRRMLHDDVYANSAQYAIRSVVMLGTPNGGSACADTWSVNATAPLLPTTMATFNVANPGYPETYSTLVYSDFLPFTCFDSSDGDSVVPDWSAQNQPVNYLYRSSTGVLHTSMTANTTLFNSYVKPALALNSAPATPGLSATRTNPNFATTKLYEGTFTTGAGATTTQSVTLETNRKLVVNVVTQTTTDALTLTYVKTEIDPAQTVTVNLTQKPGLPVFTAELLPNDFGTGVARNVTLSGTTSDGAEWSYSVTSTN